MSLLFNIFICREDKDIRIWKSSTLEKSLTNKFYLELKGPSQPRPPPAYMWLGLAPHGVEAFCLLAVARKVSTTNKLRT